VRPQKHVVGPKNTDRAPKENKNSRWAIKSKNTALNMETVCFSKHRYLPTSLHGVTTQNNIVSEKTCRLSCGTQNRQAKEFKIDFYVSCLESLKGTALIFFI
jgi:hypothetical protein